MANMSDYLESQIVAHCFRTGSWTKPTVLAVCLCTASPTDAGTGASCNEVTNTASYARQTLNPLDANWAAITGNNGTTSNSSVITFPTATADYSGVVTHIAITDSATYGSGNMLYWGALSGGGGKTVSNGDVFSFAIGALTVTATTNLYRRLSAFTKWQQEL